MSYGKLIDYADAAPEAQAVMDDIKRTRGVQDVNNAWKAMARHPGVMKRFWEHAQAVMQPGALDAKTKELVYLAVSVARLPLLHGLPHRAGEEERCVRGRAGGNGRNRRPGAGRQ